MKKPSIPRLPILMYHTISGISASDRRGRRANSAYFLPVERFREQMRYIRENGYRTLHLDQLLDGATQISGKSLVITFDDGWEDNYENVFPILREYGLAATLFVITGAVGKNEYVDWHQLREMSEKSISIQSHTVSHAPLAQLSAAEIKYELEKSKGTIEDALGKQVNYLSLPHGIFNKKVLKMVEESGYRAVCTSEPGFSHGYKNLPVMKRINIAGSISIGFFSKIVQKNRWSLMSMIGSKKIKNLAKKIVGYDIYRKVYNLRYQEKN